MMTVGMASPALAATVTRTVQTTLPATDGGFIDVSVDTGGIPCELAVTLALTGETVTSPGGTTTFTAPFEIGQLATATPTTIEVVCEYDGASYADPTLDVSVDTGRLAPYTGADGDADGGDADSGTDGGGLLPGTGGASLWLLLAGLVLVAGGAVVVTRSRRAGRS